MRWAVVIILLLSGCLGEPTIKEKFVCQDGAVFDSPDLCQGHGDCPPSVCPEKECPEQECPVCPKQDCPALSEGNFTTTTAAPSEDISDDECVKLGCPAGTNYVASKGSTKYHLCGCRSARVITKANLVCYKTRKQAETDGKQPCAICLG